MKKNSISVLLMYFGMISMYAQITFQKNYGGSNIEEGCCVKQTADGGYIITGNTDSYGAGQMDVYLIKTNSLGDTLWTKTFGFSGIDAGRFVQQNFDGGYIITGYTNNGSYNYLYLIKTNSLGDTLWTKIITGINVVGNAVQQTIDSGYIVAGQNGNSNMITDFFLVKTAPNGDTLWAKRFTGAYSNSMCFANAVKQTLDGGYIIAGSEVNNFVPASIGWLIKTDANGDTTWTKQFTGLNFAMINFVNTTSDGGYILTGTTYSIMLGWEKLLLIKTNSFGDTLWTKIIGGDSTSSLGQSVQQTVDGGYIVSGDAESSSGSFELWLLKTNSTGDTIWTKSFYTNGLVTASSVQQTLDFGYILAASIRWPSLINYDVLLIKTDSLGNAPTLNLSLNEFSVNETILFFPNPFTTSATLQLKNSNNKDLDLIITNSLGQVMRTIKVMDGEIRIYRESLVNGMYFYQLTDKNKIIGTGKFIVE